MLRERPEARGRPAEEAPKRRRPITANVGIGRDGNGFGLKVELIGRIPGLPREEAEALMPTRTKSARTPEPPGAT